MHFSSDAARVILRHQKHPVFVIDVMGRSTLMSGAEAAATVLDDTVAYGHRQRIKVVKPSAAAIERARKARTDIREVMSSDPRLEHVQKMPQARGGKTWVAQHVNARSGQAGGLQRPMRPRGRFSS